MSSQPAERFGETLSSVLRSVPPVSGNMMASFILIAILGRWLGPSELGEYLFAVGVIQIACVAGGFGLSTAALRLLPLYRSDGEKVLLAGFIRFASVVVAVASGLFYTLIHYGSSLGIQYDAGFSHVWWIATLVSIGLLLNALCRALGLIWSATFPQGAFRNLSTLALAGAYLYFQSELDAQLTVFAFGFSTILAILLQAFSLSRQSSEVFLATAEYQPREWLGSGLQFYPIDLARALGVHAAVIFLRIFEGAEVAGHFGAAFATAGLLMIPVRASLVATQRTFSILFRDGGIQAMNSTIWRIQAFFLSVSMPTYLIFSFFPGTILAIFGQNFSDTRALIPILGARFLFAGVSMLFSAALSMTSHVRISRALVVWPELFLVLGVAFFASKFGVNSVAWLMVAVSATRATFLFGYWLRALRKESHSATSAHHGHV